MLGVTMTATTGTAGTAPTAGAFVCCIATPAAVAAACGTGTATGAAPSVAVHISAGQNKPHHDQ